jgi:hypothetical protein
MSDPVVTIGGLPLPSDLVSAIRRAIWRPPSDPSVYVSVFGEQAEHVDEIERQNVTWQSRASSDVFGEQVVSGSVGIDPTLSVVIGDLGPDMPIALDYRVSRNDPRVLYLGFTSRPTWKVVADNFTYLLRSLGLDS